MRISEAATGVGEQMADVGLAMQRAVDKTENMKARADAVSELEAAGTFDDLTALGSGEDDIDRQLKQLSSQPAVDDELAKMKAELGAGRRRGPAAGRAIAAAPSPRRRAPTSRPEMIVRISGEDQYRARRRRRRAAERARGAVIGIVEAGDEDGFGDAFATLLEFVRAHGERRRGRRPRGLRRDPAAGRLDASRRPRATSPARA